METYSLYFIKKTDDAIFVHDGDKNQFWLPFSLINFNIDLTNLDLNDNCELDIPDWLAIEKGIGKKKVIEYENS